MPIRCSVGMHKWSGCKCPTCGRTREEGHDWSKDCQRCVQCGRTRKEGHVWAGCRCVTCGKGRNVDHDWSKDCETCAKCGNVRVGGHDWATDCEKCCNCGKTRPNSHAWDDYTCAKCGTPQYDCEALKALFMGNPGLVNSKNEHGWTLLHRAARKCRRELLEALLANKADINAKSNGGETPLHAAHKDAVEVLLANGSDANAKDSDGQTPLHWAARDNRREVVEVLLANKVDVDARDKEGRTPLHLAAINNCREAVAALLANSADVNAADQFGLTPFSVALRQGFPVMDKLELLEMLTTAGANVPMQDETFLLIREACFWGRTNMWPEFGAYPQYARIRELGRQISEKGGIEAMRRVAVFVDRKTANVPGSMTLLNQFWNGIGEWMA